MGKQVRADLALREIGKEDAVDTAGQEPGQPRLAHAERQFADVLAVADQDIEGVELDLGIMRECRPSKSDRPSTPSSTASPSSTNEVSSLHPVHCIAPSPRASVSDWGRSFLTTVLAD